MTGPYLLAKSYWQIRGFVHAHRIQRHPHRWAWVWTLLAFILFGASVGTFWGSFEVALRNQSIGDVAPVKVISKWTGYFRIHPKKEARDERR